MDCDSTPLIAVGPTAARIGIAVAVGNRTDRSRAVIPAHHDYVQITGRLRRCECHRHAALSSLRRRIVALHVADRGNDGVCEPVGQAPALAARPSPSPPPHPQLPAGVVAVMVVLLATTTLVARVAPNVTVAPEAKLVPVIVTEVPPAVDPVFGETLVTVGGAR